MALQYCQVCGVLIPNAPAGVEATICEKCFSTRKLIIAGEDESSGSYPPPSAPMTPGTNATTVAPDRVQFGCPSCQSVLALAAVKKRTKIKCPRCMVDFYMHPDGRIEVSAPTASSAATTATPAGPQSKLLADLKPISSDLAELLEKVPEKKVATGALPSVLDSDRYAAFREESSGSEKVRASQAMVPAPLSKPIPKTGKLGPPPMPVALPPPPPEPKKEESGIELVLTESSETGGAIGFAPDAIEQATPRAPSPSDSGKKQGRIATARRSKDQLARAIRERDERDLRAAEAQRHTLALMDRKRREAFAAARLYSLALVPLVIALVCLASTTQETGFATKGAIGTRFNDLGEVVRRGVEGWRTLLGGK